MKPILIPKIPKLNKNYQKEIERLIINHPDWIKITSIPYGYNINIVLITSNKIPLRKQFDYIPNFLDDYNIKDTTLSLYIREDDCEDMRMIIKYDKLEATTKDKTKKAKELYNGGDGMSMVEVCKSVGWNTVSFYLHVLNIDYN